MEMHRKKNTVALMMSFWKLFSLIKACNRQKKKFLYNRRTTDWMEMGFSLKYKPKRAENTPGWYHPSS